MANTTTFERLPVNILTWIFFFGSNVYTAVSPGAAPKTSYLTPAAWAFYVWTLINALLAGMLVLQFFDAGFEPVIEGVGWRFLIIGVLNGIWASLFHHGHYILGFVFAILLALAVSTVYWDMKNRFPPKNTTSAIFVSLPFSLWHAYAVFLVVLTGFTAFSKDTSHHATLATKVVACIALVFLASTAVGYAFHSSRGDIAGAAVIAWMLLAIFSKQHHPRIIHWFALASFIVSLLAIVKAVVFTARNPSLTSDDGERAPLIAGSRE